MGGVQNNMRTRESAHVFRPRGSATKYNQTCICSIKPVLEYSRKFPGVYLTRLQFINARAVKCNLRSRRDCVRYLLSPILCFIKRCYDKEEFDIDRP